ncbi:DUF397 domain-containing protein [Streptomyces carpaticus]|uniref:DUF397 domain-containing protein n=1 Tax=Streptomyces carpaticus TaxID=285558 RepID=UPI0022042C58|nr:DUF397 domain-containing protein [Streptomyces carpaticus]
MNVSRELVWFKSSYSDAEGSACVEVAHSWFKSSYSDSEGSACVEVARDWRKSTHGDDEGSNCVEVAACPTTIHVRDSKCPADPHLSFRPDAFTAFLDTIR